MTSIVKLYYVNELYPAFLENKYGLAKNLPTCYGRTKSFAGLTPPIELELKKIASYRRPAGARIPQKRDFFLPYL